MKYISSFVDEHTNNKWSSLFERLLKTKVLKNILCIDNDDIQNIFIEIEEKFKKISYYWMQRGIFMQSLDDFENAEVFLQQAKTIRPTSYQIRHAHAKNRLERALYELRSGISAVASYYFEDGENNIIQLINSPNYSNSLCYSIHTSRNFLYNFCYQYNLIELCNKLSREKFSQYNNRQDNDYNAIEWD